MTFHEWINTLFETEVDLNDFDEETYYQLEDIYREVMK